MKAEDIKASFSNGLLQLTIPMPEETTPKEVKVHVEHAESKSADRKRHEFASCQSSIATPFGNDGGQACDFSVTHITLGGAARVFVVSMPGNVAQRDETQPDGLPG